MKLVQAQVKLFQNIVDSTPVAIQPDVTCLVGKNESGKTAFLKTLYRLNPAYESEQSFDVVNNYPRWRLSSDRRTGNVDEAVPVQAIFELEADDVAAVEKQAGTSLPAAARVLAERNYAGELTVQLELDEAKMVASLVQAGGLAAEDKVEALACDSFDRLLGLIKAKIPTKTGEGGLDPARLEALKKLRTEATKAGKFFQGDASDKVNEVLVARLPKFFYFGDYSGLPGRIDLDKLLGTERSELDAEQRTARALLDLADVEGKEFTAENFENRIAELEAAANEITQEVFTY